MAAGAISGNGVYSDFDYKGQTYKVAQWYNDAMDAVGLAAYRKAKRAADDVQEKAIISRMFSLGHFSFDAVVGDFGLDLADDLMATFLFHLLKPNYAEITEGACLEMVRDQKDLVREAIANANPRKAQATPQPSQQQARGAAKGSA